jgi:hypothetical protein
MVTCIRA